MASPITNARRSDVSSNESPRAAADPRAAKPRYASDPLPGESHAVPAALQLGPVNTDLPVEERSIEALRLAMIAFPQTGNWVQFYREMFGETGVCRRLFPDADQMRYFEMSDAFAEIHEMIAALRSHDVSKGEAVEPERMITIRIPKSLHDSLRIEAEHQNLSINKLCITKLLQRTDPRNVPLQKGRRRGRRPGPQLVSESSATLSRTSPRDQASAGEWKDAKS